MKLAPSLVLLGLSWGCSSSDGTALSIEVSVGHETGAMDQAPPVAKLSVTASSNGQALATASAAPGGTLDFGQVADGTLLGLDATGTGATEAPVMRGRSIDGVLAGTDGIVSLFVERTDAWARPPGQLERSHIGAPAAVVGEQYLMLTGGAIAKGAGTAGANTTEFYDLLGLGAIDAAPFPIVARSLVMQTDFAIAFSDDDASAIDFTTQDAAEVALPSGLASFADVAGGRSIDAPSGVSYLVGATRDGAPTDAVVAVATDGTLSALHLAQKRAGAAAAWIENVGLVVAGGSATGAGVEVLGSDGATFGARPFPIDPTVGAALVATGDGSLAALVGGTLAGKPGTTRTLDAGCVSACVFTTLASVDLPASLTDTWGYALAPGRLLALGSETTGANLDRSFVLDLGVTPPTVKEILLREPRAGATPLPAPNGTLALMGGVHPDGTAALTVEMLFPQ